jgi:branched-chain amino acid transport system ATP-binding protein
MLAIENICKSFGGLMAVNNISFSVEKGEISSIIGPNGAGKTTLFNLLTGHLTPDRGKIIFRGDKISGLPPYEICKKGIGRSFQRTNIFPRLSVFDNILVAVMSWQRKSNKMFCAAKRLFVKEISNILESIELADKKNMTAGLLAHGDQRLLEIGIALGCHPDLLLLDEPTAGMSPEESSHAVELIKRLALEGGFTLIFIEHDMNVVFGISEKVRVMHMGNIIVEGKPEDVKANEEVQRIYLVEEE